MADDVLWPVYTETVTVQRYMVAAPTQKAAEDRMAHLLANGGDQQGVTYMRQVRTKETVKQELPPCAVKNKAAKVRCTRPKGHLGDHANGDHVWRDG